MQEARKMTSAGFGRLAHHGDHMAPVAATSPDAMPKDRTFE